jgi:hypothetical protein
MKRVYEIQSLSLERTVSSFIDTEKFTFRPDKKWPWLQKICFAILRKLGANSIGEVVKIERRVIDSDSFMQKIFEQKNGIQTLFRIPPKELLIGAEDYAELMRQEISTMPFDFRATYSYDEYKKQQIVGLDVKVIPWMRGILVVP